MKTMQWTTVDKSNWPRGEWDGEPDKMQWQDEATGLPCLIVRGPSGSLCGYVGVAEGHRCFGIGYDEVTVPGSEYGPEVHGGLTFADFCAQGVDHSRHVCHLSEPGEPDRVWWFGFDCAHSGDTSPAYAERIGRFHNGDSYKSIGYVKREVASLAEQLKRGQTG